MRKPGTQRTQPHNERGGAAGGNHPSGGTKQASDDDEQHDDEQREKPVAPTEQQRGERAPQIERDQPAERQVPTDPSP